MNERKAQAQSLFSGGFVILLLIVLSFLFLIPTKNVIELGVDVKQETPFSQPQITNAQIGSVSKPQYSIFSSNPSGYYAITTNLTSEGHVPIYKEFIGTGIGRSSFIVTNEKPSGLWHLNVSLYQFNQTLSRWENMHSVVGDVNFG